MNMTPPTISLKSFTCPHCNVLARQYKWGHSLDHETRGFYPEEIIANAPLQITQCDNCKKNCIWIENRYVYPQKGSAPQPNPDMPDDVKADYQEAALILNQSPRGAAALLRLCVQKLMISLGKPGKNINEDIASLVATGLPAQIQQALDIVRVTGNNAVHPGKLDANDIDVANQLFPLLNVVVEYQISLPARIKEMYEALPAGTKEAVAKRDGLK